MSSGLPHDDTPSFAGNYGLDGYSMYDDYGEGVAQGGRLPEAQPHAKLPDGNLALADFSIPEYGDDLTDQIEFDTDTEDYQDLPIGVESENSDLGDLGDFMKEGNSTPGPVDFTWLEGIQDPQRLPEPPYDKGLLGIQEAWGTRTNGKTIYPINGLDLDVERIKSTANEPANVQARIFSDEDLANIVQAAMRKSAAGEDLENILREVDRRIGLDSQSLKLVRPLMAKVVEDHGLAGKVFVRASAYPGCHNGRWKDDVKKKTASANYLVEAPKCNGCVKSVNGSCSVYNKNLVKEIPWKTAFNLYARKLEATGIRVASTGNDEADLRKAFGAKSVRQSKLSDVRPVHVPVERISEKAAMDALKKAKVSIKVIKRDDTKGLLKRVTAQIRRWQGAGLLKSAEVVSLLQEENLKTMAMKASRMAQKRASASSSRYAGTVQKQNVVSPGPSLVRPQDVHDLLRWASQRMSEGAIGVDLDKIIRSRFPERVINAAADKLKLVRSEHEGLSGHLYVHAAAYASGTRDAGCAKGAAKLRTSSLKLVLAMDRCKGCVRNHSGVCSRYNKKLSTQLPIRNKKAFKQAVLAKTNKKESANVYGRGSVRTASAGESLQSLEVNPIEEYNLYGSDDLQVDFDNLPEAPLNDGQVSFDGGIVL